MAINPDIGAIAIAVQVGLPPLLEGNPGAGKTALFNAIGEALGRPVISLIAALHEPSDFNGLPYAKDGVMKFLPAAWVNQCLDQPNSIVFFDEITTTPPAVQGALLRVLHERVVGEVRLPETVSFAAACNPADQAPGGWELALPLANRMLHLTWTPKLDEWINGTLSDWPTPVIPILPKSWQSDLPTAKSMVAAFLSTRPQHFSALPKESTQKAFPTPRMWTHTASLLAACRSLNFGYDHEITSKLIAGAVGPGVTAEFLNYATNLDLPDPEKLLQEPDKYAYGKIRGDQLFALLGSVASAVISNNTAKRWQQGWRVLFHAAKDKPDVACHTARLLAKNKPAEQHTVPQEVRAFADILIAAGQLEKKFSS